MLPSSPVSSSEKSTSVRSTRTARWTRAALHTAYAVSEDFGTHVAERLFTSPRRYPRPDRERAILARGWPFTVDVTLQSPRRRGSSTTRRVAAWRWGHGPTVLLVHGWEGRGAQLGAFIEPLVAAGLSVVAFDALGHGDSPGHRLYLTDMADCVIAVARQVGPLHAIVAHSAGASATLLAYQRGGIDAKRNVMIAPNAMFRHAIDQFGRSVALDERDCQSLEHQLARHSGLDLDTLGVDQLADGREAALLVVHDRDDREIPVHHGERLAAAWRQAKLHITHGLGHRRILRDRAVISEVVSFVQHGVPAPASPLVREVDRLLASDP